MANKPREKDMAIAISRIGSSNSSSPSITGVNAIHNGNEATREGMPEEDHLHHLPATVPKGSRTDHGKRP